VTALAAVDLGASSGRVIVGQLGAGTLALHEVARFPNTPVRAGGTLHWDILRLYQGILDGLRAAGPVESVGIDSWGCDFGLLDSDGVLLGNPVHYRDGRTEGVRLPVPAAELYATTGVQYLPFNTSYQLAAGAGSAQLDAAATLLQIPDLIAYWLTGEIGAELTNASTTQLLDARSQEWAVDLMRAVGIRPELFPPLRRPGEVIGEYGGIRVTAVGSHDTASAVAGVPAANDRFGYISCGTWSLVGVELDSPVLTAESRSANFTNEIGVAGTVRYLRNVMGLWLLQESLRTWETGDLEPLLRAAARLPPARAVIDPDDPVLLPPGDMPRRIAEACARLGQPVPSGPAETVRCILDSLALAHRAALLDARRLSGKEIEVVHIVGGGSRNELLCQLTADAVGLPVEAGPVEAGALGNILVQAGLDRTAMRALIRATQPVRRYEPGADASIWVAAARTLDEARSLRAGEG
jgi:rhamnulokinase